MRWDAGIAKVVMTLESLQECGLWNVYWQSSPPQRVRAARKYCQTQR